MTDRSWNEVQVRFDHRQLAVNAVEGIAGSFWPGTEDPIRVRIWSMNGVLITRGIPTASVGGKFINTGHNLIGPKWNKAAMVFLPKLPTSMDSELRIRAYFHRFGLVRRVTIYDSAKRNGDRFAFVDFYSAENAELCLNSSHSFVVERKN